MEKPDVLTSQPLARPTARGRVSWLGRHWDFLAVLLLILASLPVTWLAPRSLVVIAHPGTFDDHWVLDTPFKTSRGVWFGRDVAFPYGPLFQWLFSAPARAMGLSMAAIYTTYRTPLLWCTFLFGYLTLRLLLPEQPPWKRFLLLILLSVFWAPWDGRTALDILLFALFLRGWYAVGRQQINPVLLGCGAALLCAAAFLYSADTGVFAVAALLITLAGIVWEGWRESQLFRLYSVALLAFTGLSVPLVFAINAAMSSLLDFRFWRTSLALVNIHRWNEPAAMSDAATTRLFVTLVVGSLIFVLGRLVPGDRVTSITARTGFLLSAFVFAFAAMQIGLVRSDPQHIVFALYPMMFFAGAVLFSFRSRAFSALAVVVVVACSMLFGQPVAIFQPLSFRYRVAQMRRPLTECPSGFREFSGVCYPAGFDALLQSGIHFLQQHSEERDSVVLFPYQYIFGLASDRNVAGGVLQSFLASGPYLSQFDIAGYQRAAAPAGLYFPDGELSIAIDEVPNFTRTPEVWFWINRHYRSEQEVAPSVFGLLKDDSRAQRIALQPLPLTVAAQRHPVRERSTVIDLGDPAWPIDGADFLRLGLTVRYGPLWKLRKPERLQLEITRADGSRDLQSFVVEPNVSSEVWFYPWNQTDLAHYFDADERRWRTSPRPAVTHLRLLITPLDWVSQQAESVAIESAVAVRMSMPSSSPRACTDSDRFPGYLKMR
jgi:hypothetical protein